MQTLSVFSELKFLQKIPKIFRFYIFCHISIFSAKILFYYNFQSIFLVQDGGRDDSVSVTMSVNELEFFTLAHQVATFNSHSFF